MSSGSDDERESSQGEHPSEREGADSAVVADLLEQGGLGGSGVSRSTDTITNLDRLSSEERTMLDRALKAVRDPQHASSAGELGSEPPGVVVGVLKATQRSWDVRPLMLDMKSSRAGNNRTLHLVRLSHPEAYLDSHRKGFLEQQLSAIERGLAHAGAVAEALSLGVLSCGAVDGQLWIRRPYFDRLLSDIDVGSRASAERFQSVVFAQRLISLVAGLHQLGIVHGHLCPQNVAVIDEKPIAVDYGFYVLDPQHLQSSAYAAPELSRTPAPTTAADVFGLGKILRRLLTDGLSSEHRVFLDSMCHPDPERRPSMTTVQERFVPTERVRVSSAPREASGGRDSRSEARAGATSSGKQINPHRIKAGKLLGREGEVTVRSPSPLGDAERNSSGSSSGVPNSDPSSTEKQRTTNERTHPEPTAQSSTQKHEPQGVKPASVDHMAHISSSIEALTPKSPVVRRSLLVGFMVVLILLGVWKLYTPFGVRVEQFQRRWESADSAVRSEVVHAALYDRDQAAQAVIIDDAKTGTRRPGVRLGLLRVAFNSLWAEELNDDDVQQVLAFALASLMKGPPPEHQPLAAAHPGVQLAAIGDLDFTLSEGQFGDVPVSSLAKLPAPYGPPFAELQRLGVSSMGDPRARALAHVVVGNLGDDAVGKFVGVRNPPDEFLAHALIIAPYGTLYPDVAQQLQARMRERDDVFTRRVEWFRIDPAGQWTSVPEAVQVQLGLGIFPDQTLSDDQLADLLTFPAARVRKSAVSLLVKSFNAAYIQDTLQFLAGDEHRLTRPQVVLLVSALLLAQREPQNPSVSSFLAAWFRTTPDPQSVLALLAVRSAMETPVGSSDSFNIEATRYVSGKSWEATIPQLRALVFHREKLARAMAYSRLDGTIPEEHALLEEAVRNESDDRLRAQLLGKLKSADVLRKLPSLPRTQSQSGMQVPHTRDGVLLEPLPEPDPEDPSGDDTLDTPL